MVYQALLFDVDDTLLDFQKTEKKALKRLFNEEGVQLTDEIENAYKLINRQLWQAFELGEIDKKEVTDTRFSQLFSRLGKQVDGKKIGVKYRDFLSENHDLLGNSREIISALSKEYALYVVTNGVAKVQYQRLNDAQLTPFFKAIFVSEEVGYQKPMNEYFRYVFNKIPNFEREKTLIIGDSLESDIQGGKNAGIDTVWVNIHNKKNDTSIVPTYEISQLEMLTAILQ